MNEKASLPTIIFYGMILTALALTSSCGDKDDPNALTAGMADPTGTNTIATLDGTMLLTTNNTTFVTGSGPISNPSLAGTRWAWISDSRFTLVFEDQNIVSGELNCKPFRSTYEANELGRLTFPIPFERDNTICQDSAPISETNFLQALTLATRYLIDEDLLTVDAGDASIRLVAF